jgi:hypothetical protein
MVGMLTTERAQAGVSSAVGVLRRRHWLPVTIGYALALTVVTVVFARVRPDVQARVLADTSTNLHNLGHGHLGTLLSSAFVIGDTNSSLTSIPLLACLLALVELRFGAWHTVRTFLAGHIGATLLVAAGLWVAVLEHWQPDSIGVAEDVGISYGTMTLFGMLIVIVPARRRIPWALVWAVIAVKGVLNDRDFTSVGHLVSYGIGLLIGVIMLARGCRARMNWADSVRMIASSALAVSFLLG